MKGARDPTTQRPAAKALAGCSIVPFAIDDQWGVPYFLLGREHRVRGWSGSEKWSDFGGSARKDEAAEACAAREFWEETLGLVRWPSPEGDAATAADVERSLRRREYVYRVDIRSGRGGPAYAIFIKQVPWQPEVRDAFRVTHRRLLAGTLAGDHPAKAADGRPRREYMEKTHLRWWSVMQLQQALRTGSLVAGDNRSEYLRKNFRTRLACVLREFPTGKVLPPLESGEAIDCNTYKCRMASLQPPVAVHQEG